jgi:hypothetical protein
MAQVNDPVRLVLKIEYAAATEPVEGLVCSPGSPARAFSGWSELFAVLMSLTSDAARPVAISPDDHTRPGQEPDAATQSDQGRNHPCEPS